MSLFRQTNDRFSPCFDWKKDSSISSALINTGSRRLTTCYDVRDSQPEFTASFMCEAGVKNLVRDDGKSFVNARQRS